MNRRDFFRRTIPATAVTVASVSSGWGLDFFRRVLASVLRRVEEPTTHTVATLAQLYARVNTDVKTAVRLFTEEAKWFRDYPVVAGAGVENRIPLRLA